MNHSTGPQSVDQQRYESCSAEQARLRMIKIAQFRTIPKIEPFERHRDNNERNLWS
jgi:hypothetical protein